ncbi:MAG: putative toxin-antitoxin system toxin component, PIN family [Candidatus Omnitrophica bacterium]|nr:putative toxin-antitoxin system toxin component, PIN family [Candidatus Omnitrophota bacterium]
MRVVLDSNVLVAAFATHGVCHELFEHCLKYTTILCGDFIAGEVERILIDKIKIPARKSSEIIRYLKSQAQWISPERVVVENLRDPNDHMIIATALSGEADYLITGDKDMLVLKKIKRTIIISPREYWILCHAS